MSIDICPDCPTPELCVSVRGSFGSSLEKRWQIFHQGVDELSEDRPTFERAKVCAGQNPNTCVLSIENPISMFPFNHEGILETTQDKFTEQDFNSLFGEGSWKKYS